MGCSGGVDSRRRLRLRGAQGRRRHGLNAYNLYDPSPLGGFKASGYGRDLVAALAGYTESKSVWINPAERMNELQEASRRSNAGLEQRASARRRHCARPLNQTPRRCHRAEQQGRIELAQTCVRPQRTAAQGASAPQRVELTVALKTTRAPSGQPSACPCLRTAATPGLRQGCALNPANRSSACSISTRKSVRRGLAPWHRMG